MEEEVLKKKEDEMKDNEFKEPKKGNGLIIGLLIVIILGLAGFIVYDKVLKKDEPKGNDTPVQTSTPEPVVTSTPNYDYNLVGKTYKTSDGKNTLKIVSKNDKEAVSKAKKLSAYESYSDEISYLGYYNEKIILLFDDNPDGKKVNNNNSKYVVLGGQNGQGGQCRDSHGFIINVADNTLVNLSKGSVYEVYKVGEKYYFAEGDCAGAFLPIGVYDENLKKLGYYYINSDSSENIYVLDEGKSSSITKYDKNGSIVKKTSQKYTNEINSESVSYGDTLYIIAKLNKQLYLIDVITEEKYALKGLDSEFSGIGIDGPDIIMDVNNNMIEISKYAPELDEKTDEFIDKYTVAYTFNPETKELTKK